MQCVLAGNRAIADAVEEQGLNGRAACMLTGQCYIQLSQP